MLWDHLVPMMGTQHHHVQEEKLGLLHMYTARDSFGASVEKGSRQPED